MRNDDRPRAYRKDSLLTHLGRNPEAQHGAINPPVYHASTILSKNIAEWENRPDPRTHFGVVRYGLSGTPRSLWLRSRAVTAPRSSAPVWPRSPRHCKASCRTATTF